MHGITINQPNRHDHCRKISDQKSCVQPFMKQELWKFNSSCSEGYKTKKINVKSWRQLKVAGMNNTNCTNLYTPSTIKRIFFHGLWVRGCPRKMASRSFSSKSSISIKSENSVGDTAFPLGHNNIRHFIVLTICTVSRVCPSHHPGSW